MKIEDNRLIEAEYQPSPNHSGHFESEPDTIVIHFTAGGSRTSSSNWLCDKRAKASCHIVLGRDEKISQLVDFDTIAWHAGRSSWLERTSLNKYSIGIEIDNAGKLKKSGQEYYSHFGRKYDRDEVFIAKDGIPWHAFTEWQIENTVMACLALKDIYPIELILGHHEISPGRKVDPGPAFPLDYVRNKVLNAGRKDQEDESISEDPMALASENLNIRSGPGPQHPILRSPLPKGEKVKVMDAKNGWTKVEVTTSGWVSSRYLKT